MKRRARRYLARDMSPEGLARVGMSNHFRSWNTFRLNWEDPPPLDLAQQIMVANISTKAARDLLVGYTDAMRQDLRRRQRCGLSARIGAKLIERLRHMAEDLPTQQSIGVIQFEPFQRDEHIVIPQERRPRQAKKRQASTTNFKKAA